MKKYFKICLCALLCLACAYVYLYARWEHLWEEASPLATYAVKHCADDTLRVIMIGDSWAGLHKSLIGDSVMQAMLTRETCRPTLFESKGKGGEESRGIYQLMFETEGYGTKRLLEKGPDYCIISAGINDAAHSLGTKQYIHHMRLILEHLTAHGICPVLIETPEVNIWSSYGSKPFKDLTVDYLKSKMTGSKMYQFQAFREALKQLTEEKQFKENTIWVRMERWNGKGISINPQLFLPDSIHLNPQGYEQLDSCIAAEIARRLKNPVDSTFVYQPVGSHAK